MADFDRKWRDEPVADHVELLPSFSPAEPTSATATGASLVPVTVTLME